MKGNIVGMKVKTSRVRDYQNPERGIYYKGTIVAVGASVLVVRIETAQCYDRYGLVFERDYNSKDKTPIYVSAGKTKKGKELYRSVEYGDVEI